jgi:hypothetical protein
MKRELQELKGIDIDKVRAKYNKEKNTKKAIRALMSYGPLEEEIVREIRQKIKDGYLKRKSENKTNIFEYILDTQDTTGEYPKYSNIKSKFGAKARKSYHKTHKVQPHKNKSTFGFLKGKRTTVKNNNIRKNTNK